MSKNILLKLYCTDQLSIELYTIYSDHLSESFYIYNSLTTLQNLNEYSSRRIKLPEVFSIWQFDIQILGKSVHKLKMLLYNLRSLYRTISRFSYSISLKETCYFQVKLSGIYCFIRDNGMIENVVLILRQNHLKVCRI